MHIYTQLVEFTFKHIVSKGMQKLMQHESKISYRNYYPSMLHDHFTDLSPILEKKKKKKKRIRKSLSKEIMKERLKFERDI